MRGGHAIWDDTGSSQGGDRSFGPTPALREMPPGECVIQSPQSRWKFQNVSPSRHAAASEALMRPLLLLLLLLLLLPLLLPVLPLRPKRLVCHLVLRRACNLEEAQKMRTS